MLGATDNLSRAASAVLRVEEFAFMDYEMDGSGECGGLIAAHHEACKVAAVEAEGFTPESYNAALRERLAPEYPRMSYRTYDILRTLEVGEEEAR